MESIDTSRFKHQRHELSYVKLNEFRKDDKLCDVILKSSDGKEINAHKCLLVSHSEYFERMFIGDFIESKQNIIHIKNISYEAMQHLIDFMYTGVLVKLNEDNVDGILNGADIMRLEDVRNECVKFLMQIMCDETCLMIKYIADARMIVPLSEKCLNNALKRFKFVSNCSSFLDVDITQLKQLLHSDDLNAENEEDVYKAVIKWVRHNESGRKHLLPELLSLVRLVYISQDYLNEEIKAEPLVCSNPECLKIVTKVIDHFNFEYGDSLSKLVTTMKPRKSTKTINIESPHLTGVRCTSPDSACEGEKAIDLLALFTGSDIVKYQKAVWELMMNESNFLNEWFEDWKGVNSSYEESDYD